ncbi:hypothetical protein GUJ93_ZPchr0011g27594 [Zizania palustris]|uniref:Uncharacterized protein n=1 Tax=Zizania palustris TaxID=103762 RepID=A0A8J5WL98_ZIZPA|nr:hypothetical protein GUJ93_ZPchr0011g27594 [Zizania palustris]
MGTTWATTRTPCSVAAARSTLSIPKPRQPMTRSLPPEASNTSCPTLVPDRTMSASQSGILAWSSLGPTVPSFSTTRTVYFLEMAPSTGVDGAAVDVASETKRRV